MNEGDRVKVKQQFHRPSRVGQTTKVVSSRSVGEEDRNLAIQHFIVYEKDGLPDWINEYDLELVEESHEFDAIIEDLSTKELIIIDHKVYDEQVNPNITEVDGKKVLNL